MGVPKICVLGAGVVGLTSALELQEALPTAEVTVIADKFNQDTTSDGAAGLFRPGTSFCGPSLEITKKWILDSYEYYNSLLNEDCGIREVSGYIFSSISSCNVKNHYLEGVVPVYRMANREELRLCPGEWKHGAFFSTLMVECRRFLPWALARFQRRNGKVINKKISSLDELLNSNDVVMNCSGFGARHLCKDYKVVPIRGQVEKVRAPWLKNFYYGDFDTYIIPGSDGIATLGGVRNYDSYCEEASRHDRAAILERCESLVPQLKSAPLVREWVALRPHRDPVRVELEATGGRKILIHNYGHGGYGVTSAPGTSKDAVKHLLRALSSSISSKL